LHGYFCLGWVNHLFIYVRKLKEKQCVLNKTVPALKTFLFQSDKKFSSTFTCKNEWSENDLEIVQLLQNSPVHSLLQ